MRASGSLEPILPLRGYLLSVGGALLLLLLVADRVLPTPLPGRFAQSEVAMPPIRIHSDAKRPERVVIDTNQLLPMAADKEISTAALQPGSQDAPEATHETNAPAPVDDGENSPLTTQVRDSLPEPGSGVSHGHATPRPRHKSFRARSGTGPRSAQSDTFAFFRLN